MEITLRNAGHKKRKTNQRKIHKQIRPKDQERRLERIGRHENFGIVQPTRQQMVIDQQGIRRPS